MAEYKKAAMDPRLLAGLVGAAGGAGLGHLTSEMLWKKPSKMQRILTILAGAGLGGVGSAALAGAMAPGSKRTANNAVAATQAAAGRVFGDMPSKQQWQNMSDIQKAMHRPGFLRNTIPSFGQNGAAGQTLLKDTAGALTGLGAGWGVNRMLNRYQRAHNVKADIIQAIQADPTLSAADKAKRIQGLRLMNPFRHAKWLWRGRGLTDQQRTMRNAGLFGISPGNAQSTAQYASGGLLQSSGYKPRANMWRKRFGKTRKLSAMVLAAALFNLGNSDSKRRAEAIAELQRPE